MVKDLDTPIAPCETVNGHTNGGETKDKYTNITQDIQSLAEDSRSTYVAAEGSGTESIKTNKTDSYIEEDIDESIIVKKNENTFEKESNDSDSKKAEETADIKDQEFVFIHDAGFIVKIVAPGVEPFDIQVNNFQFIF